MSEWKEYKLGDIVTLEYGKDLQGYRNGIGIYDVFGTNGKIGVTTKFLYEQPSVIIGRKGAYRGIHLATKPFFVIGTAFYTKALTDKINTFFLYYWLKTIDIDAMDSGSAIPSTNRDEVYGLDISLPSLPEQKAITDTLSSLDDKIDLLRRQNATLEAMAQTLFRQWFVEGVGDDWKKGNLGDVIAIFDSKRVPVSKMNRNKMKEGKLYPYYGAAKIMDYVNDYIFDGEYILLGEDGTVRTDEGYPILQYATGKFWVNNHAHIFQAKKPYSNFFIWNFLKKKNITKIVTGAVQPKINQTNLKSLDFPLAPLELIAKFNEVTEDMFKKMKANNIQIRTLEKLRDTLLPKLMSGKVRMHH
jgi:type I restriction enzyme, S subunit